MKKNMGKKLKNNEGITLVALVVTIIVLLILAGVSLSAVFSQQGIFNRAENAVDKHSQSKARETLDLVFSEAQMKKYDEGLTEEELDKKIEEVGELIPKEDGSSKYQLVIVDGYIYEIDRSVPKVVEYKGPADGIIITATVSGNNGWVKPGESVTVKGSIKIYGEESIASSSATSTNNSVSLAGFPTKGGDFTINNITADTDIKIIATDNTGKTYEKIIQVVIKRDTTAPTIDKITAKNNKMSMKFSATGNDKNSEGKEESGIKQFKYTITSEEDTTLEGIPADKREGIFTQGKTVEIMATKEAKYIISISAVDNAGNESKPSEARMTTMKGEIVEDTEGLTISEAKAAIQKDGLKAHIGDKVRYNPVGGGTWRVFYYDTDNYFGDGIGTLYLKRDCDTNLKSSLPGNYSVTTEGRNLMKQMNPKWRDDKDAKELKYDKHEKAVSWLYEPSVWKDYVVDEIASYAMGGPSVELLMKSYNIWKSNEMKSLICTVEKFKWYQVGVEGNVLNGDDNSCEVKGSEMAHDIFGLYRPNSGEYWIASVSMFRGDGLIYKAMSGSYGIGTQVPAGNAMLTPVVALSV